MKRLILFLTVLSLVACDDDSKSEKASAEGGAKAEGSVAVPTSDDIQEEIDKGVEDVKRNRGPKWKVSYEGDLKGEVEGGIMTSVGVSKMTTIAGMAMNKDKTGGAKQRFNARIMEHGEEPVAHASLTLADGTKCSEHDMGGSPSSVKIESRDPLRATFSGKLKCGDDDTLITYEAMVDKEP